MVFQLFPSISKQCCWAHCAEQHGHLHEPLLTNNTIHAQPTEFLGWTLCTLIIICLIMRILANIYLLILTTWIYYINMTHWQLMPSGVVGYQSNRAFLRHLTSHKLLKSSPNNKPTNDSDRRSRYNVVFHLFNLSGYTLLEYWKLGTNTPIWPKLPHYI